LRALPIINSIRETGIADLRGIAQVLNSPGVRTALARFKREEHHRPRRISMSPLISGKLGALRFVGAKDTVREGSA
jgi:hypothetical protein